MFMDPHFRGDDIKWVLGDKQYGKIMRIVDHLKKEYIQVSLKGQDKNEIIEELLM